MKKLSEIYKELGIDFTYPIVIANKKGNTTYREDDNGYCWMAEYDAQGNKQFTKDSENYWCKREYDDDGICTYFISSTGYEKGTPKSESCDYDAGVKDGYEKGYKDAEKIFTRHNMSLAKKLMEML